jgi:hypothetical protein
MFGEVLGELEAGEAVGGDDSVHHSGSFEDGEVAVGGALGELVVPLEELGQAHRAVRLVECTHEGAPIAGVALAPGTQATLGKPVNINHD